MGKIRVLTENDRTLIFDLIPGLLVGSMISRIRARHFDLIAHFNSSPEISGLIDKIRSTGGKSQLYTKKLNFDFLPKVLIPKIIFHQDIQNMKFDHKKSRKSKIQLLQDLEIFLS